MSKKTLVIEDEKGIARFLQLEFEYEGYHVQLAFDGRTALELLDQEDWDLVILDIMLPDISGLEVCRRIRSQLESPIIVMLTARDSIPDRVSGLDAGADDYLTKPFAIEELFARVRAVERRRQFSDHEENLCRANRVTINLPERRAFCDDQELKLTTREFDLLSYLIQNKNRVLTRDMILEQVWGFHYVGDTNVVDVYIRYLRSKLHKCQVDDLIETVRGVGYVVREN